MVTPGPISPWVVEMSPSSIAGSLLQPQPLSWDVMSECIDLVICFVDWMFVGWSRESSDSIVVSHVVHVAGRQVLFLVDEQQPYQVSWHAC